MRLRGNPDVTARPLSPCSVPFPKGSTLVRRTRSTRSTRGIRTFSLALSAALLLGFPPASVAADAASAPKAPAAVPDYSTAESGNPIVDGWYADPDVAVYDGRYWIYPTTSQEYDQQTYLNAFSSTDMVHWTEHPKVLDIADIPWAKRALWAPAPVERNGKYYLYFAANDIQNNSELGGIGVAVADRPEGPYQDALGKPLISQFHNGAQPIDQDVFIDDDGQAYMYYGGWHHANVVKLNPDMTSLGTFADGTTYKEITPENYTEGSFMFKRNGKYYLMWSEGGWTGPDYSVSYAMSDSPTGPFKKIDKVLGQDPAVARGSGHNSVVNVPGTDIWYILYHRRPLSDTEGNHRQLAYDRMYFNEDGTIRPVTMKVQDDFGDDNAVGWHTYGDAQWSATRGAYSAAGAGGLALQDTNFSDLVYEADVTLTHGRGASGLAFRVTEPGTGGEGFRGYYADLTTNGLVLGKSTGEQRTELARARFRVAVGRAHHVKIEAIGSSIKVYVDGMAKPRLSVTDGSFASGANGVRAGLRGAGNAAGGAAAGRSLARFDNVAIRSNVYSFEAAGAPNRFIRHDESRGRVDPNVTPYADMQWKVVPGLADPAAVSLESVNYPGHYLRRKGNGVWSDALTDDDAFRADATWRRVPGLSDKSLTSFESYAAPGQYLSHRASLLRVGRVTAGNRPDATFRAW